MFANQPNIEAIKKSPLIKIDKGRLVRDTTFSSSFSRENNLTNWLFRISLH